MVAPLYVVGVRSLEWALRRLTREAVVSPSTPGPERPILVA